MFDCIPTFSNPPPWKRLIDPTLHARERIQLITSIFSDRDEVETFKYLSRGDAQVFVDVVSEVSICVPLLRMGRSDSAKTSAPCRLGIENHGLLRASDPQMLPALFV